MRAHEALLAKRRDRAIASILGTKERECDRHLPSSVQGHLRKVVLDQINELHDVALDILRSLDDDSAVLNDLWLARIDEMHTRVADIHRAVAGNGRGKA